MGSRLVPGTSRDQKLDSADGASGRWESGRILAVPHGQRFAQALWPALGGGKFHQRDETQTGRRRPGTASRPTAQRSPPQSSRLLDSSVVLSSYGSGNATFSTE